MAASYAIIICHGSYHTPIPYQPFIIALQTQGIEAYCPQLPTSDLRKLNVGIQESSTLSQPNFDRPPPSGGYPQPADDALVINELLDRLIEEEGKNVILLGHSAGGFVATYSARRKYQRKVRQASNLPGGLVGIFYVCAFMIPVGESVHSFFQPKDGPGIVPPYCQFHGNGFEGIASTVNAAQYFFSGLPEEKAKYYESTMTASPVPTTVLDNDAYTELPCAYVIADSDLALPAAFQEAMVVNGRPWVVAFQISACGPPLYASPPPLPLLPRASPLHAGLTRRRVCETAEMVNFTRWRG
ncbi:hypothetical protein UA08_03507 [Talaromyces atroroseus]|uniref:AB hydrolase-1 domain-containing protein n=1 Tax=Talaromyces atroroseus TaxID=1441469 RepID=A0A225AI25_TALAT|nr:hypothetical protein UA08_03507 [Talaromyces atroroseus]OKL61092.1 hypothetical protein UA08_03507 [Talaromyces atroroseus]